MQILLVEDNRGDVMLVQQALEEHDLLHDLHLVTDGESALRFVALMGKPGEPPCPDVMLLDLNLPKVDGSQILSEFRKHPQCTQTPVIIMTSSDAAKDRERVDALGISHYFRKPIDFDAFMKLGGVIRKLVEGQVT